MMAECGCDKYKRCAYSDYKCCIDSFSRKEKTRLHYESKSRQPQYFNKMYRPVYYNDRCPCDEFLECERLPIVDEPVKRDGWSCCIINDNKIVGATKEEMLQLCLSKPTQFRGISRYIVDWMVLLEIIEIDRYCYILT